MTFKMKWHHRLNCVENTSLNSMGYLGAGDKNSTLDNWENDETVW